ncbi:FAD-dependent oxidoreductase [Saccharothrix deserti]|uniref:FAD-dependent oxidoreductase n=1 Tax=Saccharothrix deserti TaxID=2593674 RepID=UPI00131D58CF|nr:FAD-dependent monooxygenase [Saccharothrix deserti]
MPSTRALVLGGGLAGMLAASVLAEHVDRVTIIDRDRFTDDGHRGGAPQTRHTHVLMAGGSRALDELLPGFTAGLVEAGAHHIGLPNRLLVFTQSGWLPRLDEMQFVIGCSRALLDRAVERRVLAMDRVDLVEAADVVGLLGDRTKVTGARVRDRDTGTERDIDADFVVDATGRGSKADRWLTALGLPAVREDRVDSGMVYATCVYRAPAGAEAGFPGLNIGADPRSMRSGQGGVLVPIEDGRWIVSLAGTRGGEPDVSPEGFLAFARGLRHPAIADLISAAEPLTRPFAFHGTVNRRRRYERLSPWPSGFVVLGDAACAFNPVYGHGMTVVARQAIALRDGLARHGLHGRAAKRLQRRFAGVMNDAWDMAVGQDLRYPATIGPKPGRATHLQERYLDRLILAATGRATVTRAQIDAYTLSAPMRRLLSPRVVLGVLRGPGRPPLTDPPFTEAESRVHGADRT